MSGFVSPPVRPSMPPTPLTALTPFRPPSMWSNDRFSIIRTTRCSRAARPGVMDVHYRAAPPLIVPGRPQSVSAVIRDRVHCSRRLGWRALDATHRADGGGGDRRARDWPRRRPPRRADLRTGRVLPARAGILPEAFGDDGMARGTDSRRRIRGVRIRPTCWRPTPRASGPGASRTTCPIPAAPPRRARRCICSRATHARAAGRHRAEHGRRARQERPEDRRPVISSGMTNDGTRQAQRRGLRRGQHAQPRRSHGQERPDERPHGLLPGSRLAAQRRAAATTCRSRKAAARRRTARARRVGEIELGGRTIVAIDIHEHTPGSTGYLDRENRMIATGDAIGSAYVWAQFGTIDAVRARRAPPAGRAAAVRSGRRAAGALLPGEAGRPRQAAAQRPAARQAATSTTRCAPPTGYSTAPSWASRTAWSGARHRLRPWTRRRSSTPSRTCIPAACCAARATGRSTTPSSIPGRRRLRAAGRPLRRACDAIQQHDLPDSRLRRPVAAI